MLRNARTRFNNFVRNARPLIIHKHYVTNNKEKDKRIEELIRREVEWNIEKVELVKKVKELTSQVEHFENKQERLYDAVYIMLGHINDPVIKRQVDAKLK